MHAHGPFGAHLVRWLEANELSPESAAERYLACTGQTLRNWIAGFNRPPRTKHRPLASMLGVEVDQVVALLDGSTAHAPKASQDGAA